MISVYILCAMGVSPSIARIYAEPLSAAARRFDINTPVREAAFLAQNAHETEMFTRFEENLRYTTPSLIRRLWPTRVTSDEQARSLCRNPQGLANTVYANRYGNGDFASGDGWRYRGRGANQLTFRDNYRDAGIALGRPYEESPELVAQPEDACLVAAWYWHTRRCNALADAGMIDAITRQIAGRGMTGAQERRDLFREATLAYA